MKKLRAWLFSVSAALGPLFLKVSAATAHLEGEETVKPSALDGLDASFFMENWYKFVLALVAAGCLAGFIIGNIYHYKKKKKE